jgi:hypothetical protein
MARATFKSVGDELLAKPATLVKINLCREQNKNLSSIVVGVEL